MTDCITLPVNAVSHYTVISVTSQSNNCREHVIEQHRMDSIDAAYSCRCVRSIDCLSVLCRQCVCVFGTLVSPAKTTESNEIPLGATDSCGPKKPRNRWGER